jgi:peroxiredoxin
MALTTSNMFPLGKLAPDFLLPDTIGNQSFSFKDLKGESGTLVLFICNHCPYVIHVIKEFVKIAKDYESKGINTIAISSNDIFNYPDDSPENMRRFAKQYNFNFPYLYDESQEVAKVYSAACTPDIYLFNEEDLCFYRGRLDESRPGNEKVTDGKDLRKALDLLLAGKPFPEIQFPSMGCNIKWK